MNSWLFPPRTQEVQFDEKWAFVGKKAKNCNPDDPVDDEYGDQWDHIAFDPENRLVVSLVVGKRTSENTQKLVEDFKERTGGRLMNLYTSDEYPPYETELLNAYGQLYTPPPTGKPGRPKNPYLVPPDGFNYAIVHKIKENGRVIKVEQRIVFGEQDAVEKALQNSSVSNTINTSYIERQNGTDRNRNSRKVRQTYCFSKEIQEHEAASRFSLYSYNFCWAVRTLKVSDENGKLITLTPAMSAGLANHVWMIKEWVTYPAVL